MGFDSDSENSSYSSLYSSVMKTENCSSEYNKPAEVVVIHAQSNENLLTRCILFAQDISAEYSQQHHIPNKRPKPSWMENVELNNDVIFKYQMPENCISETLSGDLNFLNEHKQV